MTILSLVNQLLVFLIDITGLCLVFWVYFANRKERVNQLFSLMIVLILLWISFSYLSDSLSEIDKVLLLNRLTFGTVSIFFATAYFFSIFFPKKEKAITIVDKSMLFLGIILSFLSVFTNLIIKDVEIRAWGSDVVPGSAGNIFYIVITFLTFLILFKLFKKYFTLSAQDKLKMQYFLVGVTLFAVGNIVFNVVFPAIKGNARYSLLGDYSAIFLLGFTTYAIVKKELFGMRVVLTSIMVGLIAVLLALDTLVFTPQLTLQILKGIILVIFLYFGYLLIKSISQERKRREELEKLTSQLQVAHIRLSAAYEKLQRLDQAKSEFVSIASHQLRTPLTAIKGYISMILEGTYGGLTAKLRKPLENVYQSNERLIKLVNDLLSVSRIEAGRLEFKLAKTNAAEIIESVLTELKIQADTKKIKLLWESPAEPLPEIMVDKEQARQIVLNFIDNAIRYTNKGYVAVGIKRKPESLVIVISDTGEGMEKQEIALLFESFSRGQAGTRFWTEGTGLGLYVAKKFAEMNHGKVWAVSDGKGKGSAFYIELPIA